MKFFSRVHRKNWCLLRLSVLMVSIHLRLQCRWQRRQPYSFVLIVKSMFAMTANTWVTLCLWVKTRIKCRFFRPSGPYTRSFSDVLQLWRVKIYCKTGFSPRWTLFLQEIILMKLVDFVNCVIAFQLVVMHRTKCHRVGRRPDWHLSILESRGIDIISPTDQSPSVYGQMSPKHDRWKQITCWYFWYSNIIFSVALLKGGIMIVLAILSLGIEFKVIKLSRTTVGFE